MERRTAVQGDTNALPEEPPPTPTIGEIQRHDRLGGLIHEYYRDAA
jgi:hypothetical protein